MKPIFSLAVAALLIPFAPRANGAPAAPSDPAPVQTVIDEAARRGDKTVVIPAGTYRFPPSGEGKQTLVFSGLRNLEIDAPGAEFVFTDAAHGSILFDHCENVTLRGAALRNEPIPFSQGRIVAIAEDRRSFEVQVARGYPDHLDRKEYIFDVFDPATRQWKPGTHDIFCQEVERLEGGRFRVRQPLEAGAVVVGDLIGWRGALHPDIELSACAGMNIEDVVIRNGKGFCVAEYGGEGGNHYRYQVTYGPAPEGADEPPLMACNADAFHSAGVRRGPTLDGCRFEGMGDDGVPIHGSFSAVVEAAAGTRAIIAARNDEFCRPGDTLQWHDAREAVSGEAKVLTVRPVSEPATPTVFPKDLRLFRDAKGLRYFELTFDRETGAASDTLVANPAACGGGFVVRGCTIRNHRARGMLIKAGPGLIEGCTVEGSAIAGIVLAPAMDWWNEAGYAHDVVLRDNVIRRVAGWEQPSLAMAGALSIGAYERGHFVPLPGGHRNILVERNRFENNDGVNVLVSSAVGVTLRGNTFAHPMEAASDRGKQRGVDDGALIWLTESREVRLEGNHIVAAGKFLQHVVTPTTATGTGLADGVTSP